MIQLVYVSTATNLVSDEEISDILGASRRNNERTGVTGLLLYNGRRFLQALEGEQAAVDETYHRIKGDARHRSVSLISSREIEARMFPDWSMAARKVVAEADETDLQRQVEAMTEELAPSLRAHFLRYAEK